MYCAIEFYIVLSKIIESVLINPLLFYPKRVRLSDSKTSQKELKIQMSKAINTFGVCLLNFELNARSFAYAQDDATEM